jgi:hypothetical protein
MAYILDSTTIRRPYELNEKNSTQYAVQRTLNGAINRDYFGDNKRVWELKYEVVTKTDYDTIKTIYDSYLSTNTSKTWETTEANYTISQTRVHIDLEERDFSVKGTDYLCSFTLTLTEV